MYCLKRSISYIDGSTDDIESVYTDLNEVQLLLRGSLVNPQKQVKEMVVKLDNVRDKEFTSAKCL